MTPLAIVTLIAIQSGSEVTQDGLQELDEFAYSEEGHALGVLYRRSTMDDHGTAVVTAYALTERGKALYEKLLSIEPPTPETTWTFE